MAKEKLLAIIPARTASKRLPGKNFINWFGRPIIEWVVEEVEKSELFETIIISSDDIEYVKEILGDRDGISWHQRSPNNMEYSTTVDQICLDIVNGSPRHDYVCCVYPTAYFIKANDLRLGLLNMEQIWRHPEGPDTVDIIPFSHSYGMLNWKRHNLSYSMDNGGFYWAKTEAFLEAKTLMGASFVRNEVPMVDINTYEDYIDAMAHRLSMTDYLRKDCKCAL